MTPCVMLFWGIMYVALIAAVLFVLYSIYKVIWYIAKILVLLGKVSKLARGGVTVQWLRHPLKIIFGQKGVPIFTVGMSGKNYEVSVLSAAGILKKHALGTFLRSENTIKSYIMYTIIRERSRSFPKSTAEKRVYTEKNSMFRRSAKHMINKFG